MSAIEKERERREQLRAEEELQHFAKTAQEEAERQQFIKGREIAGKENRRFLEELKIPGYLQEIIDEEQLKGAYVQWWEKYSIRNPLACLEDVSGVSHAHFEEVCITDLTKSFPNPFHPEKPDHPLLKRTKTFLTRVSLVWNIGYTETHVAPWVESVGVQSDNFRHSTSNTRWVGGGSFPSGYAFKSIDVEGSAKERLLIVRGHKAIEYPWSDHCQVSVYGRKYTLRISEHLQVTPGDRLTGKAAQANVPTEAMFFGSQLEQTEAIQQILASTFFDTRGSSYHTKLTKPYVSYPFAKLWPFDRAVPEQDKKSVYI